MGLKVILWAIPRGLSTIVEKHIISGGAFDEIHHEDFSYYYYPFQGRDFPGSDFDPNLPADYESIKARFLEPAKTKNIFLKDMVHHCLDKIKDDPDFYNQVINIFLIRDPKKVIPSHYFMNNDVSSDEIGYKAMLEFVHVLESKTGRAPIIIDASDLQQQPPMVLKAMCVASGIPFSEKMFELKEGMPESWGVAAPWHDRASKSTKIEKTSTEYKETCENNPHLKALYDEHAPFYKALWQRRLRMHPSFLGQQPPLLLSEPGFVRANAPRPSKDNQKEEQNPVCPTKRVLLK